jgi:exportin-5
MQQEFLKERTATAEDRKASPGLEGVAGMFEEH